MNTLFSSEIAQQADAAAESAVLVALVQRLEEVRRQKAPLDEEEQRLKQEILTRMVASGYKTFTLGHGRLRVDVVRELVPRDMHRFAEHYPNLVRTKIEIDNRQLSLILQTAERELILAQLQERISLRIRLDERKMSEVVK